MTDIKTELAKEFCIRRHPKGTREEIERACDECTKDAAEWYRCAVGFVDLTPELSEAEKVWRCKGCGVEQDSSGPVAATTKEAE